MLRVLDECNKVSADFRADPVHDLRVALRRCRSMADGMIAMDPDPNWKAMKKAGKALFQRLGALRDVQIMMEWIEKLELLGGDNLPHEVVHQASVPDPVLSSVRPEISRNPGQELMRILERREADLKREARVALEEFDRKRWRYWSRSLPARASRIRPGSGVFKHLALERWTAARQLHRIVLRNRSQVAFHALRIGIKRFRYIVENFLPAEHALWADDLKHMQDLLGEVHDLDVLWTTAISAHVFPDVGSRKTWHQRITEERSQRIEEYKKRTTAAESLWDVWRSRLPQGKQIQEIATRRMKLWAKALDPDFAHSERVARLSLQLYDGLSALGLLDRSPANGASHGSDPRASLYAAALLHDVGKAKDKRGHEKKSQKLIAKHATPLGWKEADMRRAALVSRFHAGPLPSRRHKTLRDLLRDEQRLVVSLSAILRLANAFDCDHDGHIRRVWIENASGSERPQKKTAGFLRKVGSLRRNDALMIAAVGYGETSSTAQAVAAERFLLESVLRRPILVRAARHR
jgi:CHAD domain-containing protein